LLSIIQIATRECGDDVLVGMNLDRPGKHKGGRTLQTLELYMVNNPY